MRAGLSRGLVAGLAVALTLGLAWLALPDRADAQGSPGADQTGEPAMSYDHAWHDGKVAVSGQPTVPCTRCHRMDRRGVIAGRPDHDSCFGSCHGPPPQRWRRNRPQAVADEIRRVCTVCHAPAAITRTIAGTGDRPTVAYPPYSDPEHGIAMSHRKHASASKAARGSPCLGCHGLPRAPQRKNPNPGAARPGEATTRAARVTTRPAHTRCIACHARPDVPPAMTDCTRCHVPEVGPRSRPFLRRGVYPVRETFSHPSHRARGTSDCAVCHGAITEADGNELPSPSMAVCGSCHDGGKAFSIVTPDCTRCHITPEIDPGPRPPVGQRYDHARHAARGSSIECATCHRLDRRGAPLPPSRDHAPCSDAGCHRDDFSATRPTTCGACHIGIEPWRKLYFTRPPRRDTEFGARFSHAGHLAGCESGDASCAGSCEKCHQADRQMALARNHDACTGSGCHLSRGGAEPTLSQCADCHRQGLNAARRARRLRSRWSVRATFRHEPHRVDPRTGPSGEKTLACTACHRGVERATTMDDLPVPSKATCLPCHDGTTAFKVTGHGCARCHVSTDAP